MSKYRAVTILWETKPWGKTQKMFLLFLKQDKSLARQCDTNFVKNEYVFVDVRRINGIIISKYSQNFITIIGVIYSCFLQFVYFVRTLGKLSFRKGLLAYVQFPFSSWTQRMTSPCLSVPTGSKILALLPKTIPIGRRASLTSEGC